MEILEGLNEQQREAVSTTEGYVRVIAGAGSGKTKTLTTRYAYLVNELGIATGNILCVTFTNKAAHEMKARVRQIIGEKDTGYICTFHGFGVTFLREENYSINYPESFIVMDTADTEQILDAVYERNHILSRQLTYDKAREYIALCKCRFEHIGYLVDLSNDRLLEDYEKETNLKRKVFLGYLYEQKKCFGFDYDDLITVTLHILRSNGEIREKWQRRLMYVMVDEFQDVDGLNYELAEILSGYHRNLFIVGDPDQTIYSWRGADVKHILDFDRLHEDTNTIILDRNYRSTPQILSAANSLISRNRMRIRKELVPFRSAGIPARYGHLKTAGDEAKWIRGKIQKLISEGRSYADITVLYRAHHVSRSIEEEFIREKIPYILYSGVEFYKRKEVKDALAYLRLVRSGDDLSFRRVLNEPKRGAGKKKLQQIAAKAEAEHISSFEALRLLLEEKEITSKKLEDFISLIDSYRKTWQEMTASDLLAEILDRSGYTAMLRETGETERLDNLAELKQSVFEFEKEAGDDSGLEEYLSNIALFTNMDKEEKKNSVKMMTIHSAKGLEFPCVFVCGLNEGIFPSKRIRSASELEEERRLAYVAYTRAEDRLFLSDAEGMNYDGLYRYPSRFIFNIERELIEYETELDESLVKQALYYIGTTEPEEVNVEIKVREGTRIRHKAFGEGKVVAVDGKNQTFIIKFDKLSTERALSMSAPLEIITEMGKEK